MRRPAPAGTGQPLPAGFEVCAALASGRSDRPPRGGSPRHCRHGKALPSHQFQLRTIRLLISSGGCFLVRLSAATPSPVPVAHHKTPPGSVAVSSGTRHQFQLRTASLLPFSTHRSDICQSPVPVAHADALLPFRIESEFAHQFLLRTAAPFVRLVDRAVGIHQFQLRTTVTSLVVVESPARRHQFQLRITSSFFCHAAA